MQPLLIVGAGPVGLTMAAELARFGVSVRIIDRSSHPTETSRALVVWSRTLELMDRMGCIRSFLDAGLRVRGASIRSGDAVLGHARFDDIASIYNFALMIPQRDTERLLIAHLESLGVRIERQVNLTSFTERADHVEARLDHADGRDESLETPWLIGCDGAHSTVRHGREAVFEGSTQGDDWLLADVRLEGNRRPVLDEIATYLHRDGPFIVFPIPGGRARVIATIGGSDPARPRPDPKLADVQSVIDRRAGGGFQASDPIWITDFRINERKVHDYKKGRVLLAGDAAHVHSPAGGQGMNTGMQDAINLAWKLSMVMRHEASPDLVESYSPERSAVGDMVLRNASRLTDMATLSHPAAQAARNLAIRVLLGLHTVRDKLATTMSEIEIAYPKSSLSEGPGAGERWSPEHYDGPPPGSGSEPRFVLYTSDLRMGREFAARFPALLDPRPRSSPETQRLIIVRPDGYIGLSGGAAAWNEAEHYLQRLVPANA